MEAVEECEWLVKDISADLRVRWSAIRLRNVARSLHITYAASQLLLEIHDAPVIVSRAMASSSSSSSLGEGRERRCDRSAALGGSSTKVPSSCNAALSDR